MNCDGFSSRHLGAIGDSTQNDATFLKRFVILWHALPSSSASPAMAGRASHFDLMFEESEHLVTFELPKLPIPGERVPIRRLADHRLLYLDFEGLLDPGPLGQERGHVTRWTHGSYRFYRWSATKLILELTSDKLSARIAMLPGDRKNGQMETKSILWPPVTAWELRVPRWDLKRTTNPSLP